MIIFRVLLVLGAVGVLGACNPREVCRDHYDTSSRQEACFQGVHEVYGEVTQRGRRLPLSPEAGALACESACADRYEGFGLSTDEAFRWGQLMQRVQELQAICTETCSARVALELRRRAAAAADTCLEMTIGGATRCIR